MVGAYSNPRTNCAEDFTPVHSRQNYAGCGFWFMFKTEDKNFLSWARQTRKRKWTARSLIEAYSL